MIIGIHGRAQSGKDTLAHAIQSAVFNTGATFTAKTDVQILHFADALRGMAEAVFGCRYETQEEKAQVDQWWQERIRIPNGNPDALIDHPISPLLGDFDLTGRRILQYLGTEIGRNRIHPDIWLFALERRIAVSKAKHHIIADVRFDNEAAWVRKQGGMIIHIVRADQPPLQKGAHASEQPIDSSYISQFNVCKSVEDVEWWGAQLGGWLTSSSTPDPIGATAEGE